MIFEGSTVLVKQCSPGGIIPAEYILTAFAMYNNAKMHDEVDLKKQGVFVGVRGTHVGHQCR